MPHTPMRPRSRVTPPYRPHPVFISPSLAASIVTDFAFFYRTIVCVDGRSDGGSNAFWGSATTFPVNEGGSLISAGVFSSSTAAISVFACGSRGPQYHPWSISTVFTIAPEHSRGRLRKQQRRRLLLYCWRGVALAQCLTPHYSALRYRPPALSGGAGRGTTVGGVQNVSEAVDSTRIQRSRI